MILYGQFAAVNEREVESQNWSLLIFNINSRIVSRYRRYALAMLLFPYFRSRDMEFYEITFIIYYRERWIIKSRVECIETIMHRLFRAVCWHPYVPMNYSFSSV